MRKIVYITFATLLFSACVTTELPNREYALAKAAQDAATTAEAPKFAPQLYYKAEKMYKHAEKLYKDRYYDEARKAFVSAQKLSERAETEARKKQFNSGDSANE